MCLFATILSLLNPIEEFWSKVKFGVRREELSEKDQLTPRIMDSVKKVSPTDCEGWIRHSISFFERCLNEEINL